MQSSCLRAWGPQRKFCKSLCAPNSISHSCEVPAAKLRHVADKARGELGEPLRASQPSSGNNACRDAHTLVNKWGLSWKVKYSYLPLHIDGRDIEVPYISPKDFLKFLLGKHPELLLGGVDDLELGRKHLESFWQNYGEIHPEHVLFQETNHTERRLSNTLPLAFHGDEGRGLKKGNTCVVMMETVLGLMDPKTPKNFTRCETCFVGKGTANKHALKEGCMDCPSVSAEIPLSAQQVSNYKHHSFLTKYILSVLPHSYFKGTDLLVRLMEKLCEDFQDLFDSGVDFQGGKMFAALTGMKGDLKWYQAIANLSRCFSKQLKVGEPMCHQCMAGTPDLEFEDTSHNPPWEQSEYTERPWEEEDPPVIARLPFDSQRPEMILRRDVFHNAKQGTFRDYIASTVLLLCKLGYFTDPNSGNNRDTLLERAHSHFRLYCHATGKSPALRSFSSSFFNVSRWTDFGWINCKGSDTSLCMSWLRVLTATLVLDLKSEDHRQTLEAMTRAAAKGERFFKILYSHGLWLSRHCTGAMYESLHSFLAAYNQLAFLSLYTHAFTGYAKKSKIHMLAHEKQDLRKVLKTAKHFALSPIAFACEGNEDMVGRLSRLSRRVSQKWAAHRTLDLYLIQCKTVHRRFQATRKNKLKLKRQRRRWKRQVLGTGV